MYLLFLFDLDYGLGVLPALSLFCKKYVFCKAADHQEAHEDEGRACGCVRYDDEERRHKYGDQEHDAGHKSRKPAAASRFNT